MSDNNTILFCCKKVEEIFQQGPCLEWTHHHFLQLSEEIEQQTGIIISETTLKRLFGKRSTEKDYLPQASTREALAKYVGYNSWYELTISANKNEGKTVPEPNGESTERKVFMQWKVFGLIVILIAAVISVTFIISKRHSQNPNFSISVRNKIDTVPFTAIFDYSLPSNTKDTFFLNIPGLGKTPLSSANTVITHWFNYSGYFRIPVMYRNSVVDTVDVFALNRNWQPGIFQEDEDAPFKPISNPNLDATQNDMLYLSPLQLQQSGIDSLSNYMLEFRYFNFFDVSLDDFLFETIARNSVETGGKPCFDIDIELVGENGKIRCVFTQEKCFRFAQLIVSDVYINGRNHDLSMFSHDISNWNSFQIKSKDQATSFSINDELIFEQEYTKEIGRLKGIIFRYFGSGQTNSVQIFNERNELCFNEDFKK